MTGHKTFLLTLHARLGAALARAGRTRYGGWRYAAKAALFLSLYFGTYAAIVLLPLSRTEALGMLLVWTCAQALVAFNLPHDASHGSAFESRRLNAIFARAFDLVGVSSYIWHIRHDLAHHVYTNVRGLDPDVDGGPLLRMSPEDPWRPVHRFQHLYAPFFYLLTGPLLIFVVDWRWLNDTAFSEKLGVRHHRLQALWLALSKIAFLSATLAIPMWRLPFSAGEVLLGFLISNAAVGLLVALVLLPAHCMEFAPPTPEVPTRRTADEAARHVLDITLDYAPASRIASLLLGGFSTNALHHVFPDICHVHHRMLNRVVVETAKEFGVTYRSTTLPSAIASHFRFLRMLGKGNSMCPTKVLENGMSMPSRAGGSAGR